MALELSYHYRSIDRPALKSKSHLVAQAASSGSGDLESFASVSMRGLVLAFLFVDCFLTQLCYAFSFYQLIFISLSISNSDEFQCGFDLSRQGGSWSSWFAHAHTHTQTHTHRHTHTQ